MKFKIEIKRALWLFLCVGLSCFHSFAKKEDGSFHFLNIPYSARVAGVGGENIMRTPLCYQQKFIRDCLSTI